MSYPIFAYECIGAEFTYILIDIVFRINSCQRAIPNSKDSLNVDYYSKDFGVSELLKCVQVQVLTTCVVD